MEMKKALLAIVILLGTTTSYAANTWCEVKGVKFIKSVEMMLKDGSTYSDGTCQSGTLPRDSDFPIKAKAFRDLERSNVTNVWCERGTNIDFHSNGMVRSCTLARSMVIQNDLCRDGANARFSGDGTLRGC